MHIYVGWCCEKSHRVGKFLWPPSILNFHSRGIIPLTLDFLMLSLYQFSSKFNHFVEVSERLKLVGSYICPYMKVDTHIYLFLWFVSCIQNINKMDVLFGSSFAQLQDVGKPFTRCGHTIDNGPSTSTIQQNYRNSLSASYCRWNQAMDWKTLSSP